MAVLHTNEHGTAHVVFLTDTNDEFRIGISSDHGVRFQPNSTVEVNEDRLLNAATEMAAPFRIAIKGIKP